MNSQVYINILMNFYEGIYIVDINRRITFWNKSAGRITGFKEEEVINSCCYNNILNPVDDNGVNLCLNDCPIYATLKDGKERNVNAFFHHKDGHRIPVSIRTIPIYDDDRIIGVVEIFTDDSTEIKMHTEIEKLKAASTTDALTQVSNRMSTEMHINNKIEYYSLLGNSFGVLFIDIDFFKDVNDTYGHGIGDQVLILLANTLTHSTRNGDLVGRWGGEEFIVVLDDVSDIEVLQLLSEKIRVLAENSSLRNDDYNINLTVSIGATLVNKEDDLKSLVNRADQLMYESKENGRNRSTVR